MEKKIVGFIQTSILILNMYSRRFRGPFSSSAFTLMLPLDNRSVLIPKFPLSFASPSQPRPSPCRLEQEAQPRVLLLGYHEVCQLEFVYRSLMGLLTSGRKQSMAGPVHRQSTMRDRALTRGVSTAIPVPAQAMPANLGGAAPTLGPPFKLDPQSGLTFTLDPARAKGVSMA